MNPLNDRMPGPRPTGNDGQALAELALVTPILILLMAAIFQFAFVIETQMGITNAVREAARRAAAATDPTPSWIRTQLAGSNGLLAQNVQGYASGRATIPDAIFCEYSAAGISNDRVEVSVQYRNPVFFPLLSFATDFVDGTKDGFWTLTATAQMRMETNLSAAPGTCS